MRSNADSSAPARKNFGAARDCYARAAETRQRKSTEITRIRDDHEYSFILRVSHDVGGFYATIFPGKLNFSRRLENTW